MIRKVNIKQSLTSGGFSNIFIIDYNNNECILKKENKKYNTLLNEISIYLKLMNLKNIAKILDYYSDEFNNYLIIEYYKTTLPELKLRYYTCESYLKIVKNILLKIITAIKNIHNLFILHRDLKPTNICVTKNLEPIIIDFGLSIIYIIDKKHIENKKLTNIIGSYNFISTNILNLNQPSRRDDLISCFYILIYLLIDKNSEKNFCGSKIDDKYLNTNIINFNVNNLIKINNILYRLSYYQIPNYDLISSLIEE